VILIAIDAPHFYAGLVAEDGRVVRAAPILAYMLGWSGERVAAYCRRKGWSWTRLTSAEEPADAHSAASASLPSDL
jgi:hypothetical protein